MPFAVDERAVNDYYPFGMMIPERSWKNNSNYRYGYNKGSEKDDEIYTNQEGRAITTFYREGDLSAVRWWSLDPKASAQPWQSPYNMMDGNPILKNDPEGDITPVTGAIIGGASEYLLKIGEKMLYENMSFAQANQSLKLKDGLEITLAIGVGALDGGISKLASIVKTRAGRELLKKVLEVGINLIEDGLKTIIKEENYNFDKFKAHLFGALVQVGAGELIDLTTKGFKKADELAEKATDNAKKSEARAIELDGRKSTSNKNKEKSKKEAAKDKKTSNAQNTLNTVVQTPKETAKKAVGEKGKKWMEQEQQKDDSKSQKSPKKK